MIYAGSIAKTWDRLSEVNDVYQIPTRKPIEIAVQLTFYILIFNIHTQVRYVRFELKWLATSLVLS